MRRKTNAFLFISLALAICLTDAASARSSTQVNRFRATHPCPATGQVRGPCPGYVIDHIIPLCAGGRDHPSNMQWQTVQAAKAKDLTECRRRPSR